MLCPCVVMLCVLVSGKSKGLRCMCPEFQRLVGHLGTVVFRFVQLCEVELWVLEKCRTCPGSCVCVACQSRLVDLAL